MVTNLAMTYFYYLMVANLLVVKYMIVVAERYYLQSKLRDGLNWGRYSMFDFQLTNVE